MEQTILFLDHVFQESHRDEFLGDRFRELLVFLENSQLVHKQGRDVRELGLAARLKLNEVANQEEPERSDVKVRHLIKESHHYGLPISRRSHASADVAQRV